MADTPVGDPGRPRGGRSAARRQELLEAADRVVRRAGPAASMDDIAAEAGVSKPIVYRHFRDKKGLYLILAERYVEALLTRVRSALAASAPGRERVAVTLDTYLAFVEEHREAYRFLVYGDPSSQPGSRSVQSAFARRFGEEIAAVFVGQSGPEHADAARSWGYGIVGLAQLAGDWWLDCDPMPRGDLVEHLTTLLWSGLAAAPDLLDRRLGPSPSAASAS